MRNKETQDSETNLFQQYPALGYIAKWLVISSFIGVLVGSASAGFLLSLNWVTNFRESHLWLIALLPVAGFALGALYYYYGKDVEAGNNLLIDSIHDPKEIVPFKMAIFVYVGTMITHFFGGSAGREGTALQMAGGISDQLSKPLKFNASERKILLIAAVAAGFGSVFGTPLAGAIFALEFYFIGKLRYNALFPAFMSAILADVVTKLWHVPHTHYHISNIPKVEPLSILYAMVAGIVFGICAATFSKVIHAVGAFFKEKIAYPPFRPLIGGVIVALMVWLLGTTKYIGLGIPTIMESFDNQLPIYTFTLKMGFTILTLASGFKGGEVTPLFYIGATLGNALAWFLPLPIDLLAGMGFVAVFAGATNTPLACMMMAIELFGAECGIYTAIASVVAYLFSGHTSIYKNQMIGEAKHHLHKNSEGKKIG